MTIRKTTDDRRQTTEELRIEDRGWRIEDSKVILHPLSSILGLVLLAALLRIAAFSAGHSVLLTEGTTYATLSANLAAGRGYVGILGGRDLFPPPAYPALMAVLSWLTRDVVTAGLLISFVLGALLPVPVYWLVSRAFGPRSALWSGLAVALHPLLIRYSGLVWSETLYTWLLWMGLAVVVWQTTDDRQQTTEDRGSRRYAPSTHCSLLIAHRFLLAGLLLGAAYLTRAEGAAIFVVVVAWLLALAALRRNARFVAAAVAAVIGFSVLAVPYISWLSANSGRLTLESKSRLNFAITARMAQGMDYTEAAYGLDSNGQPAGPFLQRAEALQSSIVAPAAGLGSLGKGLSQFVSLSRTFVAPAVCLLLAAAGWLVAAVSRQPSALISSLSAIRYPLSSVFVVCGLLSVVFLAQVLIISLVPLVYTRYLAALVPFVAIGLGLCLSAAQGWLGRLPIGHRGFRRILAALLPAGLLAIALWNVPRVDATSIALQQDVDQARAGAWLRQQDPDPAKRILDVHSQLPYYAGGVHVPMPQATPDQVLAYALAQKVDYVVITPRKLSSRPALAAWAKGEQMPPQFKQIYADPTSANGPVIYRVSG